MSPEQKKKSLEVCLSKCKGDIECRDRCVEKYGDTELSLLDRTIGTMIVLGILVVGLIMLYVICFKVL